MLALRVFASERNDNGRHNIATYACSAILLLAIFIETSFAIMEELSPGKSSLFFPFTVTLHIIATIIIGIVRRALRRRSAAQCRSPLSLAAPVQGKLDFAVTAAVAGLPPSIAQRVRHHFEHLQVAERINERKNCC